MVFSPKSTLTIHGLGRGGGGRVLQISGDRDDQIGAKVKTPKNPWTKILIPQKSHSDFPSHKNFQRNYTATIRRNYHKSSDRFEYQKKSLLKSNYPQKYLAKFSYPDKIRKSKISNPKKSFDHPCHLKSGEPPQNCILHMKFSEFYLCFHNSCEI